MLLSFENYESITIAEIIKKQFINTDNLTSGEKFLLLSILNNKLEKIENININIFLNEISLLFKEITNKIILLKNLNSLIFLENQDNIKRGGQNENTSY